MVGFRVHGHIYREPVPWKNSIIHLSAMVYVHVHTQRIEAWWSQLRRSFTDWWMDFFKVCENNNCKHVYIIIAIMFIDIKGAYLMRQTQFICKLALFLHLAFIFTVF